MKKDKKNEKKKLKNIWELKKLFVSLQCNKEKRNVSMKGFSNLLH